MTGTGFSIRPLASYAEMKRGVEFQRVIWGTNFTELVPAVMFWAAARTGGIVAGAFDSGGDMLGLLFGFTGWDGTHPVHWSDMLGVHPAARGRGIGLALKRYQRNHLLDAGITHVQWTFDPLVARNAHINFARLGVTAREYIRDCYGASTSPLHQGIGTDRLVAEWRLTSPRVRGRMDGPGDRPDAADRRGAADSPRATDAPGATDGPGATDARGTGATVRFEATDPARDAATAIPAHAPLINPPGEALRLDLEDAQVTLRIPAEIQTLKEEDAVAARRWREHTRAAFEAYLGRGYEVRELVRDAGESRYLLVLDGGGAPG